MASHHPLESTVSLVPNGNSGAGEHEEPPKARPRRDLIFTCLLVFVPLSAISLILLAFTFYTDIHVPFPDTDSLGDLGHYNPNVTRHAYYTKIPVGGFTLVGSWASTASQFVLAPFMFLFSYLVAKELAQTTPPTAGKINIPSWSRKTDATFQDTWLHLAVYSVNTIKYEGVWPSNNGSSPDRIGNVLQSPDPEVSFQSSYSLDDLCSATLNAPLDPLGDIRPIPCSINTTDSPWNVAYSTDTYTTLLAGISDVQYQFDQVNSGMLLDQIASGSGTQDQIIIYNDTSSNQTHALLFNMLAPALFNNVDFIAETTSMVTNCTSATQACQMTNQSQSTTNNSTPFRCSDLFYGDLNTPPQDGLEQFKGYWSRFYTLENGNPTNISVQSQLNPFTFNVSAAVDSVDFSTLIAVNDPQVPGGAVVDAGSGRVAFALTCTATVYDVNYTLVGLGRYVLFEDAAMAIASDVETVAEYMSLALSQTGLALASGVFDNDDNIAQQLWSERYLTRVPASAFWFLVVTCLLYAALGLAVAAVAFTLRRNVGLAKIQSRLLPYEQVGVKDILTAFLAKIKKLFHSE
ncbi:MAG: hypothetical protein Q9165_003353 [Trypethelium subeluteriae]